MTVQVTKRYDKMRLGDITLKREPTSGWWLETVEKSYLYFPYNVAVVVGAGYTAVNVTRLLKVLRPSYWPDKTLKGVSYRQGYNLYPAYKDLPSACRKSFDEKYYMGTLLDTTMMVGDKPVIAHDFSVSYGRWRASHDTKFIRHNHCPSWAAFLVLDSLPVATAA